MPKSNLILFSVSLALAACTASPTSSLEPELPASTQENISPAPSYTHPEFGYTINFPDGFTVESITPNSLHILKAGEPPAVGPANFIYISVIPPEPVTEPGSIYNYSPDQIEQLRTLKIGETASFAAPGSGQEEWFTYTRVDDTEIAGQPVPRFENTQPWEFPRGTTEVRYLLGKDGTIYLLGSYTGGGLVGETALDPRLAHSVIQSFTLPSP